MATVIDTHINISSLDKQLNLSDQLMLKDLNIKNKLIWDLLQYKIDTEKRHFYPKLFLLSYILFNKKITPKIISMAAIIQFIYLASEIQKYEGSNPEYPVLIGDYLYSQAFVYLCDNDMYKWIPSFSRTISQMQFGSIIRFDKKHKDRTNYSSIVKEYAPLGEVSCLIGTSLAKAPGQAIDCFKELGFNLGLIFGLMNENKSSLTKALEYLKEIEEQIPYIGSISIYSGKVPELQLIIADLKSRISELNSKVC